MSAKIPANWYSLDDLDGWYRRRCGNYEVRRVPTLDCLATEALHTPDAGPAVSLGVYSSLPMAMAECVEHKNSLENTSNFLAISQNIQVPA